MPTSTSTTHHPAKKKHKLIPRAIFDSPFIPQSLLTTAGESTPIIWDQDNNNTLPEEWIENNFPNSNQTTNKDTIIIGLKEVMRSISKSSPDTCIDFVLIEKPGPQNDTGKPHRMIYDHLLLLCYLRNVSVFLMSSTSASFLAKVYKLKRCSIIAPTVVPFHL